VKSRRAASRFALAAGLCGMSWGCAAEPRARIQQPLPAELADYLLDPSPLASGPLESEISRRFRGLLAGEPVAELREVSARSTPIGADPAGTLLRAQIELVAGDLDASRRALNELRGDAETATPARLLAARLAELAGESWAAFAHYDALAPELPIAARRRQELRAAATEELRARAARALDEGRADAAAADFERLVELAGESREIVELQARIGAARGDARQELSALRTLAAGESAELSLRLRRAELEVEAGDAGLGLALLEQLVAEHDEEPGVRLALERAKFAYRLVNAPEVVRQVARSPQLTRADFARLLYWLVPAARTSRPGATRIATDVLDHPAREEIVRVANLGLLRIDEVLHRFEPERDLTRAEAFRALARLAGERAETPKESCLYAAGQRWIAEPGECLPTAPVSGTEATDWLRRAEGSAGAFADR
jgi:hypothetical protein